MDNDKIMTVDELAEHLGVSRDNVYLLVVLGMLPQYKVDTELGYRQSELCDFIARQTLAPTRHLTNLSIYPLLA